MEKKLKKLRLLIIKEIEFLKKKQEKGEELNATANIIAWQAFADRFGKIIGPEESTKKLEKKKSKKKKDKKPAVKHKKKDKKDSKKSKKSKRKFY